MPVAARAPARTAGRRLRSARRSMCVADVDGQLGAAAEREARVQGHAEGELASALARSRPRAPSAGSRRPRRRSMTRRSACDLAFDTEIELVARAVGKPPHAQALQRQARAAGASRSRMCSSAASCLFANRDGRVEGAGQVRETLRVERRPHDDARRRGCRRWTRRPARRDRRPRTRSSRRAHDVGQQREALLLRRPALRRART